MALYQAIDNVAKTSVGTSFATAKKATLDLNVDYRSAFWGSFQGLWIHTSSAASSPTKITIRICTDTSGDDIIIPDSDADLSFGITTATKGLACFKIDIPLFLSAETVYLYAKTDTGTVTIDKVVLTWER